MRRTGGKARRFPRRGARIAAIAIILATTGLAATGATARIGPRAVKPRLLYTCAFPSGSRQASVQIQATFPATAATGQVIQPGSATITLALPHAMDAYLGRLGATAVRLSADLKTEVSEDAASATAPWQDFTSSPEPLTAKEGLAATGTAPTVTFKAAGDAAFTAAGLSLLLVPYKADGSATSPSSLLVGCTLDAGQNATLGTVAVTGTPSRSQRDGIKVGAYIGASHARAATGHATTFCPGLPKNGFTPNPTLPPPPTPPPGVTTVHAPEAACANVVGFTDVKKLNGAALIGPGRANLSIGSTIFIESPPKGNYVQADNYGRLDFNGLSEFPPATATLLAFGFVPVTATLELTLIGNLNAYAIGPESPGSCHDPKCKITVTTLYSRVQLGISDVKINGVPLDVGPACGTAPFVIKVVGTTPTYLIQSGGVLTGSITVPPFSNCGVGENIDSIFNASVSGGGNEALLTQGAPCFVTGSFGCPPCVPVPLRTVQVGFKCPPPGSSDVQPTGRQQHGD